MEKLKNRSGEGYRRLWGPPGADKENPLTPTQCAILHLRLNGFTNDQALADECGRSLSTIKKQLADARERLRDRGWDIRNTQDAVAISAANGWLVEEENHNR